MQRFNFIKKHIIAFLIIALCAVHPGLSDNNDAWNDYYYFVEMSEKVLQEYIASNSELYMMLLADSIAATEISQEQITAYSDCIENIYNTAMDYIGWSMDRLAESATLVYGGIEQAKNDEQWVFLMSVYEDAYNTQIENVGAAKAGLSDALDSALIDKRMNPNEVRDIMSCLLEIDAVLSLPIAND